MPNATATLSRILLATAIAFLPACSGKESENAAEKSSKTAAQPPKAPESGLAKLVPAGTAIYVEAPSVDRLAASIRKVTAAFDPDRAAAMDLEESLKDLDLPGSVKEIDRTKPIGICMVLPAEPGGQPAPTFLVPAVSPENYARSVAESGPGLATAIHGNYVAVSMGAEAKPGPAPAAIAQGLPEGEIVARLDVQRLVEHFRPMIDMGLGQMSAAMESVPPETTGGMDVKPLMKAYADGIRSVLDSGQTLDFALRLDGNVLEISSALTAREGSALDGFGSKEKTDAKALARFLDAEAPVAMVLGMDQAKLIHRLQPLIDASVAMYPEPMRSSFQQIMGKADELSALIGSAMCVNGALESDGLRYAVYLKSPDAAKLVETYLAMMSGVPGITFDEMKAGEVGGIQVQRSRLRVDAEKLTGGKLEAAGEATNVQMKTMLDRIYGPEGLAFTIGTQGEVTALVLGGDDAFLASSLARISKPGALPPRIARGLEQVGDLNPCFAMQYNLGAAMKGIRDLLGSTAGMPAMPDLQATLTLHGGVDGRVWRGALSADVAELGAAVRKMSDPGPGGPR